MTFASRQLRRSPSFTLVAALTLALGIGANSAMFALVDGTLLRPLPVPGADRLVMMWHSLFAWSECTTMRPQTNSRQLQYRQFLIFVPDT